MAEESLSLLLYGPAGSGKTTLSLTGNMPTLFLDSETASRFIPKSYRKIKWDPKKDSKAPEYDGTWDICVVKIKDWDIADRVVKILGTNRHPFKTVVVDSVSEILIKAKDSITQDQFKIQHWGTLGQRLGKFLRNLRDTTADDENDIELLVLLSATKEYNVGTDDQPVMQYRPMLEGSIKEVVQYLYDIMAFIELEDVPVDPSNPGKGMRKTQSIFTGSDPHIAAKSRPQGVPPTIHDLTLAQLHANIFGTEDQPAAATPKAEAKKPAGLPGIPTN